METLIYYFKGSQRDYDGGYFEVAYSDIGGYKMSDDKSRWLNGWLNIGIKSRSCIKK